MKFFAVIAILGILTDGAFAQRRGPAGMSAVHRAILEHLADRVLDSLLMSQDVNGRDSAGDSPLHYAALGSNTRAISILTKHRADPNARDTSGWTPLHFAWGEYPNSTYMFCPVGESSPFKITYVDPVSGRRVDTSLTSHAARDLPCAETFKELIAAGADPDLTDRAGRTPLHYLKSNPRYSKFSASVLVRAMKRFDRADTSGTTVLMLLASDSMYLELVKEILLRSKYSSNADHYGRTALYFAAESGSTPMVKLLLSAGADISSEGDAIFGAVASQSLEMVKFFLDHGADPNPKMPYNQTLARSLKYESDSASQQIRQLLLSRGARDTQ